MSFLNGFNDFMQENLGFVIHNSYPRHSTRKAKEIFGSKPINVIEIGVYKGVNAKNILDTLNVKEFVAIDPYIDIDEEYFIMRGRLKDYKGVIHLLETSDNAIKVLDDNEYHFIYIDGNHDYDFVKRDIENYWKKVRKGGVLAGHDISYPSVFKAVSEFCVKNKLKCSVMGNDWIIVK